MGMAVPFSLGRRETQIPVGRSVGVGDKEGKLNTARWSGLAAQENPNGTVRGVWETNQTGAAEKPASRSGLLYPAWDIFGCCANRDTYC